MKLDEHKTYPFEVIKEVLVPEDGQYFVLRHKSGRRLLLPFETYKRYGIKPGETINCRVDKVSCTGKVYLEPEHPIYRKGEKYSFKVIGKEQNSDILIVKDCFDNRIEVQYTSNNVDIINHASINLQVINLKKGIPFLALPNGKEIYLDQMIGETVELSITQVIKKIDNEEYYFLENKESENKAELKVKHFKNYGLSVGKTLLCQVYGYTHLGLLKVEPQNPFYKANSIYTFEILEIDTQGNYSDSESILVVKDVFENRCGIRVNNNEILKLNKKTRVNCRVLGFRKGRPNLMLESN